jgi:hypothetical protein
MPPWTECELIQCYRKHCVDPRLFTSLADQALGSAKDAKAGLEGEDDEKADLEDDEKDGLSDTRFEGKVAEAALRRWASDLGSIARRVFAPNQAYQKQQHALGSLDKHLASKLTSLARGVMPNLNFFEHAHRLLVMVPNDTYTNFSFALASVEVGLKVCRLCMQLDLDNAKSLLGQMQGTSYGLAFEAYAHARFLEGGSFTIKRLGLDQPDVQIELKDLKLREVTNIQVKDGAELTQQGTYYRPSDSSFPVVDSWTTEYMFQMTVSASHPIKSNCRQFMYLKSAFARLHKNPVGRIVFVVPKSAKLDFGVQACVDSKDQKTTKGWTNLEQYLLELDD